MRHVETSGSGAGPTPAPGVAGIQISKLMLTVDQLIELEIKTRALIEELEGDNRSAGAETAAIAPDSAIGRLSRQDAMQQQEMAKAAVRRRQARVVALHEALRRMDDGTFGMCAKCQEDIEYSRLEVAPELRLCAKCSAALGTGG